MGALVGLSHLKSPFPNSEVFFEVGPYYGAQTVFKLRVIPLSQDPDHRCVLPCSM